MASVVVLNSSTMLPSISTAKSPNTVAVVNAEAACTTLPALGLALELSPAPLELALVALDELAPTALMPLGRLDDAAVAAALAEPDAGSLADVAPSCA